MYKRQVLDQELTEGGPTEFEIGTAIMFCYMNEQRPDLVILEVGIGGKWDSTNVIEAPLVTAITTVGYDHMRYLGDTYEPVSYTHLDVYKRQGSPSRCGKLGSRQGRLRYLVLQRPVAIFDDGLAKHRCRRLQALLPNHHAGNGLRHHFLLGLPDDFPIQMCIRDRANAMHMDLRQRSQGILYEAMVGGSAMLTATILYGFLHLI